MSLAGQPSRVGGIAASIVGWGILIMGGSIALALWLIAQSIWPEAMVGWALALPVSALSIFFGLLFLLGGKRLRRHGEARQRAVHLDAVRALIAHRPGAVSAREVAAKLSLPEDQADALLTSLAREGATSVTLDVDEDGHVTYDFTGDERRWRVLEESAEAFDAETAAAEKARSRR